MMLASVMLPQLVVLAAASESHVAVTEYASSAVLANLPWNAITHLHQAINPLVVTVTARPRTTRRSQPRCLCRPNFGVQCMTDGR